MLKRNALVDRLYLRGRIWWVWGYDINGTMWRESTGQNERKAALEAAKALELRRTVPADRAAEVAKEYTLGDALAELRAEDVRANAAAKTIEFHRDRSRHLLRVYGRERRVAELSATTSNEYMDKRLAEGASRHTIQKEFRVLIQALRLAAEHGRYRGKPSDLMPRSLRKQDAFYQPRTTWLESVEYCQALIDHTSDFAPDGGNKRGLKRQFVLSQDMRTPSDVVVERGAAAGIVLTRGEVQTARRNELLRVRREGSRARKVCRKLHVAAYIHTGVREGELYAIHPEHVKLEQRRVWVEGTKTAGSTRWVWLSETAVEIFRRKLRGKPPGQPIFEPWEKVDRDLKLAWRRARKSLVEAARARGEDLEAALPMSLSCNDLRRTFCSLMASAGVPMQHCAKLMGHKSLDMVMEVYGRLTPESLESAVDALPALALPTVMVSVQVEVPKSDLDALVERSLGSESA